MSTQPIILCAFKEDASLINNFQKYGFESETALLHKALQLLSKELKKEENKENVHDLLQYLYKDTEEMQVWTDSALKNWQPKSDNLGLVG